MARPIGEALGDRKELAERENSAREGGKRSKGTGSTLDPDLGELWFHIWAYRAQFLLSWDHQVVAACLVWEFLTKHWCWGLCRIPQSVLGRELTDELRTDPNIFSKLRATPWLLRELRSQASPLVLVLFPPQLSLSLQSVLSSQGSHWCGTCLSLAVFVALCAPRETEQGSGAFSQGTWDLCGVINGISLWKDVRLAANLCERVGIYIALV